MKAFFSKIFRKPEMKRPRVIKGIALGLVVVMVAGGGLWYFKFRTVKPKATVTEQTTAVARGLIQVTITGTGSVTYSNKSSIANRLATTITKINVAEGASVKAGDVIMELDDTNAKASVAKVQASLAQAQLTQQTDNNNAAKLQLSAPFAGQVSSIQVKKDDVLGKNAAVLTLTDTSKLKAVLGFGGAEAASIRVGQNVDVVVESLMQVVSGKITWVSNAPVANGNGGVVYNVEVTLDNPGSLKDGMKVNGQIKTGNVTLQSAGSSTLAWSSQSTVKSEAGGTVKELLVKEGQRVGAGESMARIQNDDLQATLLSDASKVIDLQKQLESAQLDLDSCKVKAPIAGQVSGLTAKVGDNIDSGKTICTVSDITGADVTVSVDELDITKVKVGQKAAIKVDALSETTSRPLDAEVSAIAVSGTSSNGVTTYPVTLHIKDASKLKGGMNASITLYIENKANVLTLPIEAVTKVGTLTLVQVKKDSPLASKAITAENAQEYMRQNAQQSGQQNGQTGTGAAGNGGTRQQGTSGGNTAGGSNGGTRQQGQGNTGTNAAGNSAAGGNSGNTAGGNNANRQGTSGASGNASTGRQSGMAAMFNTNNANTVYIPVTIGSNNTTTIEIASGLSEGDIVVLPVKKATTTTSTTNNQQGGFGGIGGFGGMTGGGAPPDGGGQQRTNTTTQQSGGR